MSGLIPNLLELIMSWRAHTKPTWDNYVRAYTKPTLANYVMAYTKPTWANYVMAHTKLTWANYVRAHTTPSIELIIPGLIPNQQLS